LRFLWTKELNAKDIHKEIFPVYGGKCLSRKAVLKWDEKRDKGFADDEEVETEVRKCRDNSQKTSILRVSTHW
jgi:predicted Rdx family selenoprotein